MTKEELLARLNDIEWNDFEVKEASGGLPKSMWETVSAFSNTEGGWIVLGVKEKKTGEDSVFIVNGVPNPEQMEQDIITTLRSRTKFNAPVSCKVMRYNIDGKDILAFEIPLSPHRPVAVKSTGEVYIRTGSGDTLATDLEIDAIVRDASFGSKSELEVPGSNFNDINLDSIASTTNDSRNVGGNCENNCENSDANKVLSLIKELPSITQPKIAEATGFSQRKVNMIISALRKEGILIRIGKTKGGHWKIQSD